MPAIDIDRDTAHDAAAHELAKPIYPKASLSDRIGEWIDDLLHRLVTGGSALPGGWLTIVVLGLLLAVLVLTAVRVARRAMGSGGDSRLYGTRSRSAAEHRARAEQCAAQGDWAGAIRHRVRAIARELEENEVLGAAPGRTAGELARDAGAVLPALIDDFDTAATYFNDVAYGRRPGAERNYRLVADLDDRVRRESAARTGVSGGTGAPR